jgi:hypothetical protein
VSKPDIFHRRAEELVTRIGQAFLAGNRPAAVKLVEDAIRGYPPLSSAQFEALVTNPQTTTTKDEIWQTARRVFGDEENGYKWRAEVGRLVKACGEDRALEVLLDADRAKVIDPKAFIGAAIRAGKALPLWKLDNNALLREAGACGVTTLGKSKEEIVSGIEKARRLKATGECALGAETIR